MERARSRMIGEFEVVVGLEVHVQLATAAKAFAPEAAAFGGEPNTHVSAVSLGHPGTLPVLNAGVARHAAAVGLTFGCTVHGQSVFARKHYHYPDLPKGYQISQAAEPVCTGGQADVLGRTVRLVRIHAEEDAGKLVHDGQASLVDHNRCGVPLLEIVTEPDLRSGEEAAEFVALVRRTVRALGASDGDMEEGQIRCDANVSLRRPGEALGTKAEVKNLNSMRHVAAAVAFEAERQAALLRAGGRVVQETRLWDAERGETRTMRSKEAADDYRYLPDPDLPPFVISAADLEAVRRAMPELPDARRARYAARFGLPAAEAATLADDPAVAALFEQTLAALGPDAPPEAEKAVANLVRTDVLRVLAERDLAPAGFPVEPARLAALVQMRSAGRLSSSAAAEVFAAMLGDPRAPDALADALGLVQVSDASALAPAVDAVIAAHPEQAAQVRAGKLAVVGFLLGRVMKETAGAADPTLVRQLLTDRLAP